MTQNRYPKAALSQKVLEKIWGNDEDELALKKMKQISEKIKRGELRTFTEEEVKKKYGFK